MLAAAAETKRIAALTPEQTVPLDTFVLGLRTAWQDGEVRPTSKPKPKAKRGRRRPDPLVAVTSYVRGPTPILHRRVANCSTGYRKRILGVIPTVCYARCNGA